LLVLLSEGAQALALTLNVSLKLQYLRDTISRACELPRLDPRCAIDLINSTIVDMEINYGHKAFRQKTCIESILQSLRDRPPLCPTTESPGALDQQTAHDLMGNVTVALFSSMGITPIEDLDSVPSDKLLAMYLKLLGFVFIYYIAATALIMFMFAVFIFLAQHNANSTYRRVTIGIRVALGCALLSLLSLLANFRLVYSFMTSPMILFVFTLALLGGEFQLSHLPVYVKQFLTCSVQLS
jgi:hypothetical protein